MGSVSRGIRSGTIMVAALGVLTLAGCTEDQDVYVPVPADYTQEPVEVRYDRIRDTPRLGQEYVCAQRLGRLECTSAADD